MGRVIIYSFLFVLLTVTGYLFLGSSEKDALSPPSPQTKQEVVESEKPMPQFLPGEMLQPSTDSVKSADTQSPQTSEEARLARAKLKTLGVDVK